MTTGYWRQISPLSDSNPAARMDHKMILADQILILFGGYSHNHHYGDTWLFNASAERWLEKKYFVHERYPANCTDDIEYIASNESECFRLEWTQPMSLDERNRWEVASSRDQNFYVPDEEWGKCFGKYYGIIDRGAATPDETADHGTPLVPYAATGPNQFVMGLRWWPLVHNYGADRAGEDTRTGVFREDDYGTAIDKDDEITDKERFDNRCDKWRGRLRSYMKNETVNGTVYERCTSVYGEPTRSSALIPPRDTDGIAGRAAEPIFLSQPRKQAPGWDGCRDRDDGDKSLPQELVYLYPSQLSDHTMIYTELLGQVGDRPDGTKGFSEGEVRMRICHCRQGQRPSRSRTRAQIYIFGGVGYDQQYLPSTSETRPS
jgi:hypothetical protein